MIPELITGAAPGDIFVIRNLANVVPRREHPDTSVGAGIERAVGELKVRDIVVCGHDDCGGIKAALGDLRDITPSSEQWSWLGGLWSVTARARAAEADPARRLRRAVEENVVEGLTNLMTFPAVSAAVNGGSLRLHGWVYDVVDLRLRTWDSGRRAFVVVDAGP